MSRAPAPAKINLALVVGPPRDDGKHEVLTVLQRIDLVDRIELDGGARAPRRGLRGRHARPRGARARSPRSAGVEPRWRVRIEKQIPVAAGLGGGSSDAATALRLANETLAEPLPAEELHSVAARIGADVPFFLADGPQLGSGDGSELEPLDLPQDFWVVVLLPHGAAKTSTADVYAAFDAREGRARLRRAAPDAPRRARRGEAPARPRRPAAERPRELAARRGDSRRRRLPRRRLRSRPGALRALPSPPRRRRRETLARAVSGGPGSRHLRGTVDAVLSESSSPPVERGPRRLAEGSPPPSRALDRRRRGSHRRGLRTTSRSGRSSRSRRSSALAWWLRPEQPLERGSGRSCGSSSSRSCSPSCSSCSRSSSSGC